MFSLSENKPSHDYLFDSERRYKTFIIKLVMAIIRMARETLKNRVSFIEYNIDAKETLPNNNIPYVITCLFRFSPFSISLSKIRNCHLLIKKSFLGGYL
jgi:hypothetical protein